MKGIMKNKGNTGCRIRDALGVFTVLFAVGCGRKSMATGELAPYTCNKVVVGEIAVDGRINEAVWGRAASLTTFHVYRPKGGVNSSPTEARILWDSENLYVAFICKDADIWSFSDEPDSELWRGDVGEFFIKPKRDCHVYYEFVAAPNGTLLDLRYASRGAGGADRFKTWSSHARVASTVDGTDADATDTDAGYTIEMAIPLAAFHGTTPPADGVVWTFGVFRFDYSKLFEEPLLLMSMPESPRGFHYYEGYADLIFRAKGKVHRPTQLRESPDRHQ